MQIRWFAGAADAAGTTQEEVGTQDGTITEVLLGLHPGLGPVLERCSFLVDGRSLPGDSPWPEQAVSLDVLPPFAGG